MSPEAALIELFERVSARAGAAVFVNAEELYQWPGTAVTAMKSQKLLARARPAKSVICPGCERACAMPVHTVGAPNGAAGSFVVCDKRDDINRVLISSDLLTQWRCDAESVCAFTAKSLGLLRSKQLLANAAVWNIGIARGEKRTQMLSLQFDGALSLVAGNNRLPLAELVGFRNGEYSLDGDMIRHLVDSATTADSRYTPSNARREARKLETRSMYEALRKAYRELKKMSPQKSDVWYSQRIARMDIAGGRDAETIRKILRK